MMDLIALTSRVESAAGQLREHSASDAARSLLAWLDAACALYRQELVFVEPSGLLALQAQVRQLETLRLLAAGSMQVNGCI